MAPCLKLRLSGSFLAEDARGMALALPLRAQVILAYLAEAGRGVAGRAELAALIWPDRGEEQARASLRQELSGLRRMLPEGVLRADRQAVTLDLAEVAMASPEGARPFLDGVELRSEPFEEWLRAARARDTAARLDAALEAAQAAADKGAAAEAARLALALDPASEPAIRALMRAEPRTAALAAYEAFRAHLAEALDAAPEPETEALAAGLRGAGQTVPPRPPVEDRPTLAVLPFDEIGAAQDDMFAVGIVEEITGALSHIREFDVIARQSAFVLQGLGLDHAGAAARLGADYLVEGSVRRSGERVRIAVQLVSGGDGRTLWSERFDDRIDDLFALQDRIAAQVAGRLSPSLRTEEIARAGRRPPENRSAYELKLTALPHFWAHRKEDNAVAIRLFEEALKRDPGYVPAIAYKSWALAQQPSYMWSDTPVQDHAEALALADRAAARAGDHAPTLVAISATYALSGDDPERSQHYAERALAIDPSNAWGWMRRGWALHYRGDQEAALRDFAESGRLSPLDPFHFNVHLGRSAAYRQMGDLDAAIAELRTGMRRNPGVTWALRMLVGTCAMAGRDAEAEEAARAFFRHYPHMTLAYMKACMPPSIRFRQDGYQAAFDAVFASVGIPEA